MASSIDGPASRFGGTPSRRVSGRCFRAAWDPSRIRISIRQCSQAAERFCLFPPGNRSFPERSGREPPLCYARGKMQLADVFGALGWSRFDELLKNISIGSLRTYQVYESFKIHARLSKVNRERLRKAAPKLWGRLQEGDEVLARELAHAVLICHLSMVVEVLDFLEIAHDGNGFFDKDRTAKQQLQSCQAASNPAGGSASSTSFGTSTPCPFCCSTSTTWTGK